MPDTAIGPPRLRQRVGARAPAGELRILVIMDDPSTVDPENDTTMAVVAELRRRGHTVELSMCGGLSLGPEGLQARLGSGSTELVESFGAVLLRTDPPFDIEYLHATLLLEHVRGRCLLVNDPRALRDCNEKLFPLQFPHLTPPTIVSRDLEDLSYFVARHGGRAIIKPVDGCGGRGIFVADATDPNLQVILESATADGTRRVIAQRYLEAAAATGDKRIMLLDGEPVGALVRMPAQGQARANIHAGGTASIATLDERDREIVAEVGARCRERGLVLVGLDIIGGYLTEINVTSPAGFRMMARLTGIRPEARVVDWLEDRCPTSHRRVVSALAAA